jgi:hypothetical protein
MELLKKIISEHNYEFLQNLYHQNSHRKWLHIIFPKIKHTIEVQSKVLIWAHTQYHIPGQTQYVSNRKRVIFFFFFDVEEPLQGRALRTHPCRVNPSPVHRTLGSFPTWNWLSR